MSPQKPMACIRDGLVQPIRDLIEAIVKQVGVDPQGDTRIRMTQLPGHREDICPLLNQ